MKTPQKQNKTFLIMHKTDTSQADTLFQKYFLFKSFKDDGNEVSIWKYLRDTYDEDYPLKGSPFGAIIAAEIQLAPWWVDDLFFGKASVVIFRCTDDPLAQLLFLQEALHEGAFSKHGFPYDINRLMYETLYRLKRYDDALIFIQKAAKELGQKVYSPQPNGEDFGINNILQAYIFCLSRAGKHQDVIKNTRIYLQREKKLYNGDDLSSFTELIQHIEEETKKILLYQAAV
jgi:hypothetical protein